MKPTQLPLFASKPADRAATLPHARWPAALDQDGCVPARPEADPHPPRARRRTGAALLRRAGRLPRDAPPGRAAGHGARRPPRRPRSRFPRAREAVSGLRPRPFLGKAEPAPLAPPPVLIGAGPGFHYSANGSGPSFIA